MLDERPNPLEAQNPENLKFNVPEKFEEKLEERRKNIGK